MKEKFLQYLRTKWPAIIWSVIIFILLAMPPVAIVSEQKLNISQFDKIIHASLFCILVVLTGYYLQLKYKSVLNFLIVIFGMAMLATSYGVIMEYVQLYTGRDFDVWDMAADGIGAVLGWVFFAVKIAVKR